MNQKLLEPHCDHIAIMKKFWGLIPKIISGEKTIEPRWYRHRCVPWGRISAGDTVYFKNSGELVTAKAQVEKVLQFSGLDLAKASWLVREYGDRICLKKTDVRKWFFHQKYCLLIFLLHPESVKPFAINKTGFGFAAAWLIVGNISAIMRP